MAQAHKAIETHLFGLSHASDSFSQDLVTSSSHSKRFPVIVVGQESSVEHIVIADRAGWGGVYCLGSNHYIS